MRALAGWVLALSLAAVPAFAAGSGADSAGTSTSSTSDSSNSTVSAAVAAPSDPAASSSTSSAAPPAAAAAPQNNEPPSPLFFKIGSATFTPLGFLDLTDVFRSPAIGSGIGTNFSSLPYRIPANFPNAGLTEDRLSAQNSRLGIRIDADVAGGHAIGYLETDFLGNAATSISASSNSYTLRMRVYFIDYTKGKFELLGGQDWSMLTPNRVGINPIPGNIFFSQDMDTNYQVGLVWERTPQVRFIYHAAKTAAFGVSLENANQYLGGENGLSGSAVSVPSPLTGTNAFVQTQFDNGANSSGTNIPNLFPDLIVKAAFDPMVMKRNFHFEVSGLLKEFKANTFIPSTTANSGGTSINSTAIGGGVSANINLEVVKNLHLIANSYWSDGGGQKIFAQAPDVVIHPQLNGTSAFTVSPLHSGAGIGGAEWQVKPKLMLYGYYGMIYVDKDAFPCTAALAKTAANNTCGYGFTTATATAAEADNRMISEGTIGFIPVFWRSPNYGALQLITQYSYLSRVPWIFVPNSPRAAHGSMAFIDLRYVLP
jgi:hypothetical protein